MRLPLLLSVPHAGLHVPPEAEEYCILTPEDIGKDGDEGAAEIYHPLRTEVHSFLTSDVARAIIDLNRSEEDRGKDGVVKTHTRWDVPVYDPAPPEELFETLIDTYHRAYHRQLSKLAGNHLLLGVDCHTMPAVGPPAAPDPGVERPRVCLSSGDGTCPRKWMVGLQVCFEKEFGLNVSVNDPFKGGYTIRRHASEMPWVQLELSRAPFLTDREKRSAILAALMDFVEEYAE